MNVTTIIHCKENIMLGKTPNAHSPAERVYNPAMFAQFREFDVGDMLLVEHEVIEELLETTHEDE